ncbi:MAG TPA: hypothetical protein PKC28_03015 [Bdellovibrionales bacterium]|nr:hypothetical protein [Bdellovibrionales bacterium]
MKTRNILATFLTMFAIHMVASAADNAATKPAHDVMAACKAECPQAKSNDDAHKCAEKKGRLNKEFRKSKCWEVNEEFEKAAGDGKKE